MASRLRYQPSGLSIAHRLLSCRARERRPGLEVAQREVELLDAVARHVVAQVAGAALGGIFDDPWTLESKQGCPGEYPSTFIHAGFNDSPRRYLDLGLQVGFDDLAHCGSFAPTGFLAFRI